MRQKTKERQKVNGMLGHAKKMRLQRSGKILPKDWTPPAIAEIPD
jgi:hypothetical protein